MTRLLTEAELLKHISESAAPTTQNALRDLSAGATWILEGHPGGAEGLKYDFRLGSRILFGGSQPIDASRLTEIERGKLAIGPGEMAYVLTQEVLVLPNNVKAEIGLKRKLSHAGIVLHGGSCADPGYRGRLLFALFNFSARPFPLLPGKKIVSAQFYELEKAETPPTRPIEPILDFPDDIVHLMGQYRPATSQALAEQILDLQQKIEALNKFVRDRNEWFERFQLSLTNTERVVENLGEKLDEERSNRVDGEKEFKSRLEEISRTTTKHAVFWALLIAAAGIAAAAVLGVLIK